MRDKPFTWPDILGMIAVFFMLYALVCLILLWGGSDWPGVTTP